MRKEKNFIIYSLSLKSDIDNIRYIGVTQRTLKQSYYQHKHDTIHQERRHAPVHKWMFSKLSIGEEIVIRQIDECTEVEWEFKEQYWIKYYKNKGFDLLNVNFGGQGVITAEMRNKNGSLRSQEAHYKPVVCLTLDGIFVKKYKSINEAAKDVGANYNTSICNAITGYSKSACGYLWISEKDYDPLKKYRYEEYEYRRIKIYEFNIDGKLIFIHKSYRDIEKQNGYSENGVRSAIKNKTLYHNSFWSLSSSIDINEYNLLYKYVLTNNNKEEKFRTLKEISTVINKSESWLCMTLKNKQEIEYNDYTIRRI